MRGPSSTSEVFEADAPHALGAMLVVGELTKAGFPGLAVVAMLVTYLLYAATRQIIIFRARSEADGRPPRPLNWARRLAAHRARTQSERHAWIGSGWNPTSAEARASAATSATISGTSRRSLSSERSSRSQQISIRDKGSSYRKQRIETTRAHCDHSERQTGARFGADHEHGASATLGLPFFQLTC
jgi:hypothetical protein